MNGYEPGAAVRRLGGCLAAIVLLLTACAAPPPPPLLPRAPGMGHAAKLRQTEARFVEATGAKLRAVTQELAVLRSWVGDVDGAVTAFRTVGIPSDMSAPDLSEDRAEAAIAAIVREAETRQIVILNEAHHVPVHRAFAMRLARELRRIGFEYLACETFSNMPGLGTSPITRNTGYYSQDPVFAEFLRETIRQRWTLMGYEHRAIEAEEGLSWAQREQRRETGQAQNIVDGILARHPSARIFVYAGYGHAAKTPFPTGEGQPPLWMMASELKRLSGIDPLSIDQSRMFALSETALEASGYRMALARGSAEAPFVLRQTGGAYRLLGPAPGAYDMQVLHPPSVQSAGRVTWLRTLAERQSWPVPAAWVPANGRRLIYAVHEADPPEAIPADIVTVEAGKPAPALMLPPGRGFRFEFEDF